MPPPGQADAPTGWDDRERRGDRKQVKKKKPQEETDFRSKNPSPRRNKRESGRSWRDYEIDDEFGEWDDEEPEL
ncbi:MAG: hypothetical protein AAGA48_29760 [Myxococcota bacterium]